MPWPYPERHPGEYLERRFLEPLGLSAGDLARALGVSRTRVARILSGRTRMTADAALRLGQFLRMDPRFFMQLQAEWELGQLDTGLAIEPIRTDLLVGPRGAVPMPEASPPEVDGRFSADLLERVRASAALAPAPIPRDWVHVVLPGGQHAWESKPR